MKRRKKSQKESKIVNVKEVRIGLDIGEHDFKVKQAIRFLKSEDKVKLTVRFVDEMNLQTEDTN